MLRLMLFYYRTLWIILSKYLRAKKNVALEAEIDSLKRENLQLRKALLECLEKLEGFQVSIQSGVGEIPKLLVDEAMEFTLKEKTRRDEMNLNTAEGLSFGTKDFITGPFKESFGKGLENQRRGREIIWQLIENVWENTWDFFKKQRERVEGLHEDYPFTSPLWPGAKKEDGQETEETDLASADTGQLVASIQQLGEKVDLVNLSLGAPEVIQESLAAEGDGSSILNRLLAIDEKLNAFAGQNVEAQAEVIAGKIVEKTGGAISPEEKVTMEQVAEMISGETKKLPEQHEEILKLLGQNQNIMYGYQDQLYRLENMIQTKALSFDQIYRKVIKRMWDDYKCGG